MTVANREATTQWRWKLVGRAGPSRMCGWESRWENQRWAKDSDSEGVSESCGGALPIVQTSFLGR